MFLVGTLLRFGFVTAWVFHFVACMGGCLGCDAKQKQMKSEESQPRPCVAEATMTSSRCEVDNGGSNSSINTPDPNLDSHATENTSQPFVNHGYLMWNQSRQQWVGKSRKSNNKDQICEPRLSYNATYDTLLGSNKPFTKPVPLSEMVDFLVDVWEKEGMYD